MHFFLFEAIVFQVDFPGVLLELASPNRITVDNPFSALLFISLRTFVFPACEVLHVQGNVGGGGGVASGSCLSLLGKTVFVVATEKTVSVVILENIISEYLEIFLVNV